jgi:hypothetical protein
MTSVKWLRRITVLTEPFTGYQQTGSYLIQASEDDPGTPGDPHPAPLAAGPAGHPRVRVPGAVLPPGRHLLSGRAWSGLAPVAAVEVSTDGGGTWAPARLEEQPLPMAWAGWTFEWEAAPGSYELCSRATDAAGAQPAPGDPLEHRRLRQQRRPASPGPRPRRPGA